VPDLVVGAGAGGVALTRASGGEVRTKTPEGWLPLERFEAQAAEQGRSSLRRWRQPVILGEPEAVAMLCRRHS
jgi:hypothetical protein